MCVTGSLNLPRPCPRAPNTAGAGTVSLNLSQPYQLQPKDCAPNPDSHNQMDQPPQDQGMGPKPFSLPQGPFLPLPLLS